MSVAAADSVTSMTMDFGVAPWCFTMAAISLAASTSVSVWIDTFTATKHSWPRSFSSPTNSAALPSTHRITSPMRPASSSGLMK